MNRRLLAAIGVVAITATAVTLVVLRDKPRVLPLRLCVDGLIELPLGLCSHGDDPPEATADCVLGLPCILPTGSPPPAQPPPCFGDGRSGRRVHVFYAYTTTNEYSRWVSTIRGMAGTADRYLAAADGNRHFRWLCDGGTLRVTPIKVTGNSLSEFIVAMRALPNGAGTRSDRIYAAVHTVGGGGTATIKNDDTPLATNRANTGPSYSITRDFSGQTMLHELGHNIGAVQLSAPYSSGRWHCTDERDVMCYDDSGERDLPQPMTTPCPSSTANKWDCNDDSYWSPTPPVGSYLATHWNTFRSLWLIAGG